MLAIVPQQQALSIFAGIGATLLVASAIGYVLKVSIAGRQPHAVIDNLNARIKAWWLIVLVVALAFALGRAGMTLLFLFISFAALRELTIATCTREDERALASSFLFVLPAQYALVYLGWYVGYSIFIPVCVFMLMPLLVSHATDRTGALKRVMNLQWSLMICVFCISHVPALLMLEVPSYEGRNLLLVLFLIVVTQSCDVLQYVWGKLLGRRKVASIVSPSKTWEGLVGGVASATALGAALYWITPFTPWQAALIALASNVMGFFGGLVLSAVKRDRGVKDWGCMIDGHGGMLDRVDSVLFAAPLFFHLTRLLVHAV